MIDERWQNDMPDEELTTFERTLMSLGWLAVVVLGAVGFTVLASAALEAVL